jgi:NAD(P)-dependent dehydrogenase (short-subunit alcohol dehydrogenase family)
VLDINEEGAAEVAEGLRRTGVRAHSSAVDVGNRESIETAFDSVRSELGPIEILVTSAAVAGFVAFEDITTEIWDRVIRVNLTGTFHCIQLAIPDMVAAGWGRIVTISSAAGQQGSVLQGDYSASKGGVISLTKAVAVEYAARGITANTIPPFIVDTPMFRKAQDDGFIPADKYLERMVPQGRLGTPDDIGPVVAFLCSDGAGYITGQLIPVNGGGLT